MPQGKYSRVHGTTHWMQEGIDCIPCKSWPQSWHSASVTIAEVKLMNTGLLLKPAVTLHANWSNSHEGHPRGAQEYHEQMMNRNCQLDLTSSNISPNPECCVQIFAISVAWYRSGVNFQYASFGISWLIAVWNMQFLRREALACTGCSELCKTFWEQCASPIVNICLLPHKQTASDHLWVPCMGSYTSICSATALMLMPPADETVIEWR